MLDDGDEELIEEEENLDDGLGQNLLLLITGIVWLFVYLRCPDLY